MRFPKIAVFVLVLVALAPARAQTSTSFKLTESTLNSGGDPQNGSSASSASFRIRLDAIGDALVLVGSASPSFRTDTGFVGRYLPPREVPAIYFPNKTTMTWDPEPSVGAYEVYRGTVSTLPGAFGSCFASGLTSETAADSTTPTAGSGWFYLVTARNRIGEEGTKGYQSNGTERSNTAPCP